MTKKFVFKVCYNENGSKIIWKESITKDGLNNKEKDTKLDEDDKDIINKALEADVDIPEGIENAIPKDVLIEKIISKLTYAL